MRERWNQFECPNNYAINILDEWSDYDLSLQWYAKKKEKIAMQSYLKHTMTFLS